MSEEQGIAKKDNPTTVSADYVSAEIEKLPPEMRTMVSVMAGFFRSTTGPDPETAKILAQTEMHEETCKLQGFTESLRIRDLQNERDHEFRKIRMNHETAKSLVVVAVCLGAIICGLYLIVAKQNSSIGTPLLIAGFMPLLGGKPLFPKEKE